MKFYLAAPFFNPPQLELVRQIELLFAESNVPLFSPRLQHTGAIKIDSREKAKQVFDLNYSNITDECTTHMLAVVDWLMPEDQGVYILSQPKRVPALDHFSKGEQNRAFQTQVITGPLNLPDTGTIWEMGAAYARGIPIYLYTNREPSSALNIMLTQSCAGVLYGHAQLLRFLNAGKLLPENARQWEGKFQ